MKVVTAIILSLAIFTGFALWAQHTLTQSSEILTDHLRQLETAIREEDWETANSETNSILKKWSSTRNVWQTLIDHQEVDNIESTLAKVSQLVKLKVKDDSLAEIAALKLFVKHIPDSESLSLVNIL